MLTVVAAICVRDGRVLMAQRPRGKHLAGLWEFPGGKVEVARGESPLEALLRELDEELGVTPVDPRPRTFVHHAYRDRSVLLLFYTCEIAGTPEAREDNPVRWIPLAELPELPVPPADRDLIRELAESARENEPGLGA